MRKRAAPSLASLYRPQFEPWLLALILLLAAGLRFYHLDSSSLWSDEGNTWALLSRSFAQIARDAAADIHPPGYYWLLKVWSMVAGADAWGMRSFSAVAGLLLVYVIYRLGRYLDTGCKLVGMALLAAFLAALNPLQIYYSQEARMYMLLALESAGLFWALFALQGASWRNLALPALGYWLCGVTGLWTHYSFPVIWGAVILGGMLQFAYRVVVARPKGMMSQSQAPTLLFLHRSIWLFVALNLLVFLAYLPWLPTAIDRVLHWPKGGEAVTLTVGGTLAIRTLIFGPLRDLPNSQWPWLWGAALLPLLGLMGQWRQLRLWQIGLWLLAPLLLMFGLGLFSDAFLKFLLTASPAWCLLTAVAIRRLPAPRLWTPLLVTWVVVLAALTLPAYYTSPTVRDNYAGVAQYLQATADPDNALVILNAPGQQEVWQYYNPGLPTLALPQQRPLDRTATLQTLQNALTDRTAVYALFWATDEADPAQVVEHWLDQHTFKGLESWQGNLRFVTYAQPTDVQCTAITPETSFGESILLTKLCRPTAPRQVTAGDVALIGLEWQTLTPVSQRYKVTVQVLDPHQGVIAQRDSEPVGGSLPTDQWPVGQPVVDNHGVWIPPGTPPGVYPVIVALYDPTTGERLRLANSDDSFALGEIVVGRPERPLPTALLSVQHQVDRPLGPLRLVGYSAHRQGMAHAPETPVVAGDQVEFTFFWQAPDPLPADWPDNLIFTLTLGDQTLTLPIAGEGYPTSQWQAGELVRSKADLLYTGKDPSPRLTIGGEHIRLHLLPGAIW